MNKTEVKAVTVNPIEDVRNTLTKMESQFKAALPPQISATKFTRVTMTAIQTNPDLLQADRRSLFGEIMKCAADGLVPDGREAAFIVFNTKNGKLAKYMPMLGGIYKKLHNSGQISSVSAQVVFEKEEFKYWIDENGKHINHYPLLGSERGPVKCVYATAKMKDGSVDLEIMTLEEIEKVKAVSRAKNSGPWFDWFDEMAKKTVIRRLSKRLPMSTELESIMKAEDELYDLDKKEETPNNETQKPSRLTQIMEAQTSDAEIKTEEKTEEFPSGDELFGN